MVYIQILTWMAVAAVVFITMNLLTPFLYTIWNTNLQPNLHDSAQSSKSAMTTAGNNLFFAWTVMGYIIPGIIVFYGVADATRTGIRDTGEVYE